MTRRPLDLLAALPPDEEPRQPGAYTALRFAWQRARLPGNPAPPNWFAPDGERLGQYDEKTNQVWLSTELANDPVELVRTIGHECEHARQHARGDWFNEASAAAAGDRLVLAWAQRTAALHAKAAASGTSRGPSIRLPFPGECDTDPFDPIGYLKLKTAPTPRPQYSWERNS